MTTGPGGLPLPENLNDLHRFCRTTAALLREAHQFTAEYRKDSRKVVVWLGGLMGAGIFSVHSLLATAPQPMRLSVLLPWVSGILCAMLAALLGGELASRNDLQHFDRISILELLQLDTDVDHIREHLPRAIDAKVIARDQRTIVLNRWFYTTNTAFYLTHVFFVVGAVAAAATIVVWGR